MTCICGHPRSWHRDRAIQVGCRLISTSVVAYHLARLRAMGAIDSIPGATRTIRILERTT